MELKRVVVTGLGTINPLGKNVEEYWEGLRNGVSGAGPITRFDASKFKTTFACEIKNFNPNDYLNRKEVQKHDMYAQYAYIAAAQAIENSGLDLSKIDKDEVGVIWGAGIGGLDTFFQSVTEFNSNPDNPRFSPFFIPKMIANMASGNIAMQYGFRGPTITTVTACASATHAMIDAATYIRLGKANIFIAGGSEAAITQAGVGGFNAMHALSTRNNDPKTASRPFDKDRDGFVMGEGAGALILEEYEHAIARGATIWAELIGCGMSTDAYHMTAPDPEGGGASLVMNRALKDAGLKPEDIDYINVHGTSTGLGDIAEPKAIKKVFGDHIYKVSISATKSMTGHLLGAAGAVEAIACILAMKYSIIPPTINQFELDPEIDPNVDFTFNKAKPRNINYALSNTFGFGGHNGTVIFKKLG
ncbi:MAG: beta-ketoacyl-ACP synthase II [Prolixibacteraceae bacterium]|jgi:3-oxoacyl-[acyl-carrier-protein] synthase II|nr:beta-ketoacyl-ACP synthase II [Prolixibacteraceae bacterium]